MQPYDQKIVCTGVALNTSFSGELKVIRLNVDVTPDTTFADNGIFSFLITNETYGFESFIRNDGKIIISGDASETLTVRFNEKSTSKIHAKINDVLEKKAATFIPVLSNTGENIFHFRIPTSTKQEFIF